MNTTKQIMTSFIGGAGILCMAIPAIAQDDGGEIVVTGKEIPEGMEPVSKKVSIKDLDLTTQAGVDKMESRVAGAVKSICSPAFSRRMSKEKREICSDYAWASARPQMEEAIERARGG